jgi:hypothetical protein
LRVQSLKAVFRMRQSRKPQCSAVFKCFRQRITRIDSGFPFPAVFRRKPCRVSQTTSENEKRPLHRCKDRRIVTGEL